MLAEPTVRAIIRLLQGRGLAALWLFGSEANGRAGLESDVDLAALFASPLSGHDLQQLRADIAALLGREVDLIDLGRASAPLAQEILTSGVLLAELDRDRRVAFTAAVPARYQDVRYLRIPIERALRERLGHVGS